MPSSSHRPRKRFGQHFLHDPRVRARIVEAVSPAKEDFLVEIGPGEGALTAFLLDKVAKIEDWKTCFDGMHDGSLIKAVLTP